MIECDIDFLIGSMVRVDKPVTSLFGIGMVAYLIWVVVADSPRARIERAARPVMWIGGTIESIADLTDPSESGPIHAHSLSLYYDVQYMLWRRFYEDQYLQWQRTQRPLGAPATSVPGAVANAPVGPPVPVHESMNLTAVASPPQQPGSVSATAKASPEKNVAPESFHHKVGRWIGVY